MMDLLYKQEEFNKQKKQKAFVYTLGICGTLFFLFIIISWKSNPPAPPIVEDLLEINLGNDAEGFGEEQPLIKGDMGQATKIPISEPTVQQQQDDETPVIADDNAPDDAAPVRKVIKSVPITSKKVNTVNTPVTKATPKPKYQYNGGGNGNGNGADRDNGYSNQGNIPGARGDAGSPVGNPDSYGNTPGGKIGGPQVIRGGRRIISYPSFTSDLPKATIFADVSVSSSGVGTFLKLAKGSTSLNSQYADRIRSFLRTIKFNAGEDGSVNTVRFNFTVQ